MLASTSPVSRTPLVSIGMPVFNDVRFLRRAMDDLLAQSFDNFELIISDDQSTDGSEAVCKEYASCDSRIRYIRQPENLGISRNMEFLLNQAQGEYFMWAADDDSWDKDFIRILIEELQKDPRLALVFCPYLCIDEADRPIEKIGVRAFDYAGPGRFIRLVKFCIGYDDGCGYGLFRRKRIEGVKFPVWWGPNKKTPINNIFPPIFYFLCAGGYKLVDHGILWRNRVKLHSHHTIPFSGSILWKYLSYLLRKCNVAYESLKNVKRGSGSYLLVVMIAPFIAGRFIFDSFLPFYWRLHDFLYPSSSGR